MQAIFPDTASKAKMRRTLRFTAALLLINESVASVRFANSFQSHMVIQRSQQTSIWGFASPGVTVNVSLDSFVGGPVSVNADGTWSLNLNTSDVADEGHTLAVSGSDGSSETLVDILVGQVILCSGQSNMDMPVSYAFNSSAEIAAAGYLTRIRLFGIAVVKAERPQDDIEVSVNWTVPLGSVSSSCRHTRFRYYLGLGCTLAFYWAVFHAFDRSQGFPPSASSWGGTCTRA